MTIDAQRAPGAAPAAAAPWRLVTWLVCTVIAWAGAGLATLLAASTGVYATALGARPDAQLWVLVLHVAAWLPVAVGVLALLRALIWSRATFSGIGLAVPVAAAVLATSFQAALYLWSVGRYGVFDDDIVGSSGAIPGFLIAVGLAEVASALAVPSRVFRAVATSLPIGAILVLGAANLRGALDGIRDSSLPLALLLSLCVAFAVIVGIARVGALIRKPTAAA